MNETRTAKLVAIAIRDYERLYGKADNITLVLGVQTVSDLLPYRLTTSDEFTTLTFMGHSVSVDFKAKEKIAIRTDLDYTWLYNGGVTND